MVLLPPSIYWQKSPIGETYNCTGLWQGFISVWYLYGLIMMSWWSLTQSDGILVRINYDFNSVRWDISTNQLWWDLYELIMILDQSNGIFVRINYDVLVIRLSSPILKGSSLFRFDLIPFVSRLGWKQCWYRAHLVFQSSCPYIGAGVDGSHWITAAPPHSIHAHLRPFRGLLSCRGVISLDPRHRLHPRIWVKLDHFDWLLPACVRLSAA